MGSSSGFPSRITMKISASLLLLVSTATAVPSFILSQRDENCDYNCEDNGSCTVQYVGPTRPGKALGSCFPESSGGRCSGTPSECRKCNRVLHCPEPGECQYNCKGWPYEQCEMKRSGRFSGFASATCVNPYIGKSSTKKFSNYPECGNIPSNCERCDDYCARLEGRLDRFSY